MADVLLSGRQRARQSMQTPEGSARDIAFRGGGFVLRPRPLITWIAFALVLAVWELSIKVGLLNPLFLPAPSTIFATLVELIKTGILWVHLNISIRRLAVGWCAGTVAGLLLGLAMGLWSLSRSVGMAFVSALYPIPKIALLPLFILWLGIGETSKVTMIAFGVFFPTTIAVYSGVDAVPRNLIRMAQSFNLSYLEIIRKIVLPAALPSIIAGFRITTSVALLLLVTAEMVGAQYGIGAFILQTGNMMMTDQLLAGVSVMSVLGLIIAALLTFLERTLFRWR